MERSKNAPSNGQRLHLRVAGWADVDWAERFEGLSVRQADDGSTVICGELRDQSALFGVLRFVESLGLKVIACFAYQGGAA